MPINKGTKPKTAPYQVLTLRPRIDQGVIAKRRHSIFPKALSLLEVHHQIVLCHILQPQLTRLMKGRYHHLRYAVRTSTQRSRDTLRPLHTYRQRHTHTHTHTHIYIYMCVCVCVLILLICTNLESKKTLKNQVIIMDMDHVYTHLSIYLNEYYVEANVRYFECVVSEFKQQLCC